MRSLAHPALRRWPRPALPLLMCLVLHAPIAALAQESGVTPRSLPTSGMLGYERVRLPAGETMGLVGGSLLFDIGGDWGLGPAVYGAATGRRGGFFVGGVELQRRWQLSPRTSLAAGLYAGGGGGAAAPVGGGLMLRPALTLLYDLGPSLQAGVSASQVRFPSGDIRSNQFGLVLAWRNEFRHFDGPAGARVYSPESTGLGFDRMLATLGQFKLTDSGRSIGLVGARAERRSGVSGVIWGMEAAAAARGDAAGYMELLGTLGASLAPLPDQVPSLRVGVRVAAGLGGGGAVPTGGGLLGKGIGTIEWSPLRGWTVGAELGVIRGENSDLRARHAQVWVGADLEPGLDGRGEPVGRLVRTEWSAALQHHARSQRKDGSRGSLDTIGLKLSRYLGRNVYVTGQAHSAYAGGAGAYSIGLIGMGLASDPAAKARLGAELLAGAAGGGGVNTQGGAVAQAMLWAGWAPSPASEWRLGIGGVRAVRNGLNTPVIELSWNKAFGMAGR